MSELPPSAGDELSQRLGGSAKLLQPLPVEPGDPGAESNVENVRLMIDRQQSRQAYPLTLQDVAKSGLMLGLGVQKVMWRDVRQKGAKVLVPATAPGPDGPRWVEGTSDKKIYCGPKAEWVDPWDRARRAAEALVMALRLAEGADLDAIGARYDTDLKRIHGGAWERAEAAGLIVWSGARVALTPSGRLRSNELFAELI